ncbi:MAG: NifU family protein [Oligoflexales bacterium]|nr:NifU family protein [Oligoflexales bacterium]
MLQKIQKVIENEINPNLALHGGSCKATDFDNGVLKIKFMKEYPGRPANQVTMLRGVAPIIKSIFPEVERIILDP